MLNARLNSLNHRITETLFSPLHNPKHYDSCFLDEETGAQTDEVSCPNKRSYQGPVTGCVMGLPAIRAMCFLQRQHHIFWNGIIVDKSRPNYSLSWHDGGNPRQSKRSLWFFVILGLDITYYVVLRSWGWSEVEDQRERGWSQKAEWQHPWIYMWNKLT